LRCEREDYQRCPEPVFIDLKIANAGGGFDQAFWQVRCKLFADAVSPERLLVDIQHHPRGSAGLIFSVI
jgi:hypothetical protein